MKSKYRLEVKMLTDIKFSGRNNSLNFDYSCSLHAVLGDAKQKQIVYLFSRSWLNFQHKQVAPNKNVSEIYH